MPVKTANIRVNDLGLLRGYGIFDFFPVQSGFPVFQEEYFSRFFHSAARIRLEPPVDSKGLEERVIRLIKANDCPTGFVKLVLTGGFTPDGYSPGRSNLFIMMHPPLADELALEKGVKVLLYKFLRWNPDVKSLNYANVLKHREILQKSEALDLLYHDGRRISETSRGNFFIVNQQNELVTAPFNILFGITRGKVLEIAAGIMPVKESFINIEDILTAREAFITSTSKSVLPVVQIDSWTIGDGRPGSVSNKLKQLFQKTVLDYIHSRVKEVSTPS